jgi:formylglycine-generating enzyme required for sulfatase activity
MEKEDIFKETGTRDQNALPLGTLLHGKYHIGRILGKGGFGITYLAWFNQLNIPIVIKECFSSEGASRKGTIVVPYNPTEFNYWKDKFLEEAQTLAQLPHANIVGVMDAFFENDTAYFVMPYYAGKTLADLLKARGRLSEEEAKNLFLPILDGLRQAHNKGILHRDIKPDNIYLTVTESGGVNPILIDFGAARADISPNTSNHQSSKYRIFTPGFAPYEQYQSRNTQGTWTDIYAVAATLYVAVTGINEKDLTTAVDRLADDQDPVRHAAKFGISKPLADAIMKGMAIHAKDRSQTVEEWQKLLFEKVPPPKSAPHQPPVVRAVVEPVSPAAAVQERAIPKEAAVTRKPLSRFLKGPYVIGAVFVAIMVYVFGGSNVAPDFTNSIGMKFKRIEAGTFMMGSNDNDTNAESDEKPLHRVNITKDFYMGQYEVTQGQWRAVMGTDPSHFKGDNLPVESVSWDDAQEFIKRLNAKEGTNRYRLPTEAEWEYAARAGTTTKWSFGDDESQLWRYGWFNGNSKGFFGIGEAQTHEVGKLKPNPWGLYDMHGNVWEWCSDWYDELYYTKSILRFPENTKSSSYLLRGGSWHYIASSLRSASRLNYAPDYRDINLGFRLFSIL